MTLSEYIYIWMETDHFKKGTEVLINAFWMEMDHFKMGTEVLISAFSASVAEV